MFNIFEKLKIDDYYYFRFFNKDVKIFKIFDIFKGIKHINNQLKLDTSRIISVSRGNLFFWKNHERFTQKEKMWYISQQFYERLGYFPDLVNPKTFNEKLNWMKLHYDNPNETRCIDKYEFKNYIKEKLGEGYTTKLIGVWDSVEEINFDALPNQFVLKTNWGGGGKTGVYFVIDKSNDDIDKIKYLFNDWIQPWNNVYYYNLSRGYKDIKPKILAEELLPIYLCEKSYEYNFHCFNGNIKYIFIKQHHPNFEYHRITTIVDENFVKLPFHAIKIPNSVLNKKTENFDKVVQIAKKLAQENFPYVRIDFIVNRDKIYIGEFTFTSAGGYNKYIPSDWDAKIGEWLDLTKLNKEYLTDNEPQTLKVVGG